MPPTGSWRRTHASNASAIAAIAAPRSPVNTAFGPPRIMTAQYDAAARRPATARRRSRGRPGNTRTPAAAISSRIKRSSSPLVSSVPATMTGADPPRWIETVARLPARCRRRRLGAIVRVRAAVSICAAGTGCDQRVGRSGSIYRRGSGRGALAGRRSPSGRRGSASSGGPPRRAGRRRAAVPAVHGRPRAAPPP